MYDETMKQGADMKTAFLLLLLIAIPAIAQQPIPDAPRRVIDKKFMAVMGMEALAKSADALTTAKHMNEIIGVRPAPGCQLDYPNSCYAWNRFEETNPLFGRRPSNVRLAVEDGAFFAGETVLTYYLKKHHSRIWWLPAVASIAQHSTFAWRNTRY